MRQKKLQLLLIQIFRKCYHIICPLNLNLIVLHHIAFGANEYYVRFQNSGLMILQIWCYQVFIWLRFTIWPYLLIRLLSTRIIKDFRSLCYCKIFSYYLYRFQGVQVCGLSWLFSSLRQAIEQYSLFVQKIVTVTLPDFIDSWSPPPTFFLFWNRVLQITEFFFWVRRYFKYLSNSQKQFFSLPRNTILLFG